MLEPAVTFGLRIHRLSFAEADWRNWKESGEVGSRPTTGGIQGTREGFKDKHRNEGGERKQKQRWESKRPKRVSFSQRVMLNVTTGYLIPGTNEVFN